MLIIDSHKNLNYYYLHPSLITLTFKMSFTSVLLLCLLICFSLLFYSVDSCSTVSKQNVIALTGVCPNDTFTVPIGTSLTYECSYSYSGSFLTYWNVNDNASTASTNPLPAGVTSVTANSEKSVITIVTINAEHLLAIQCGLCDLSASCHPVQEFIGTESIQLIAFGIIDIISIIHNFLLGPPSPSSLSLELGENDTVKLSWSPPSLPPTVNEDDVLFTYNIIIMESTNNPPIVTDINVTNNTYVIITPNDILQYTQCKEYQWGVRAAGSNVSLHGFTNTTMADSNFTFISGTVKSFLVIRIIVFHSS